MTAVTHWFLEHAGRTLAAVGAATVTAWAVFKALDPGLDER